jgi:hypothetical protein
MSARPVVVRAIVVALITGLFAACSNPTAPTSSPAKASLGLFGGSTN